MDFIIRGNGGDRAMLPYYRPISTLEVLDRISREVWDSWRPFALGDGLVPKADVYEEKGQLVVRTELPGIDKKDLDITLEGDRLTIKAEKKEEVKEDTTDHARERYYGQYFRTLTLPYPVKEDKISATLDNGVLELRLPKAEKVKAKKVETEAQPPKGRTARRQRRATKNNS